MSNDLSLFVAATVPFFRTAPEADLMHRLEDALQSNAHYSGRAIEWRTDTVNDFRGVNVPAAAERLVRWDSRHPNVVFNEGFQPHVAPGDEAGLVRDNADLGTYVDQNVESVFVGTARYYAHPETGRPTRWVPRNIANMFEYEVFAAGGIDVNLSLGTGNQFFNQREVAFPGGIRPEFIRTAREYNGTGHVVAIWANPNFDISASGAAHGAELGMLPDPVCGSSIDVHYWTGPPDERPPRRRLIRAQISKDPLHGKGAPQEDDMMANSCSTPHPPRASFINPYNPQEAYFFADGRYALVTASPMTTGDKIVNGPKQIVAEWPSLKAARFGKVDAVLPTGSGYEAYFFARDEYVLVNIAPGTTNDYVINGPKKIATEWPSLKQAGCKTVDAVLPFPGVEKQAYFFCGTKFSVIKYAPGTTDDTIVQQPKDISAGWPSLAGIGFDTIDSALPDPANKDQAYFFSGDQYVLVAVNSSGGASDKRVRGPRPVYREWASLRGAGFYGQGLPKQCKP